ncbi:MAG TPA: hydroxymethylglutaryl-CoA lyase [candidate division Zixibacteria bacterium]|nr:hydroxymethylglutaryl-CoA lyase [candidate division Zixibacteria bacterium]
MSEYLKIYEVGPRDGLQNESILISTENKQHVIEGLLEAGLRSVELTSFVNPKTVRQMADADQVMSWATSKFIDPALVFAGLVFNERGYERAVDAGCTHIAIGAAVSETFSKANTGMSTAQAMEKARKLVEWAKRDGLWTRVYVSTAWICPFEGPVRASKTIAYCERLWEMNMDELVVADTIGHANPLEVGRLMDQLGKRLDMNRLAVHLHDTQALGLANTTAAIQAGVRIHDSSVGGLGGCPFAPGAAGNMATEDLVFLAYKLGLGTGVDFQKLWDVVYMVEELVGRPIGGRIRAWWESEGKLSEEGLLFSGSI